MVKKHREKIIRGFDSEIEKLREKVRKGSGKIRSPTGHFFSPRIKLNKVVVR